MATEQLQIKIGAEVSGVTQALNILQNQLARLQRLASLPNLSFDQLERLQSMMQKTGAQITKFEAVAKRTGTALSSVRPGANEATLSLINLSRVAQDAPYGFIGIANNINPLLESFQRLRASTGTTGGALKALGSSLMGAGGLGLIVGVVSSLLVVFGDNLFGSKKSADALSKSLSDVSDEAENASKQIQALTSDLGFLNQASKLKIEVAGGLDSSAIEDQIKNVQEGINKIKLIRSQLQGRQESINIFDFKVGTKERENAEAEVQKLSDAVAKTIQDESEQSKGLFLLQQQLRIATTKESKSALDKQEADRKKAQQKAEDAQKEAAQKLKDYLREREQIISEASKDFSELNIATLPDVENPKSNQELFNRLQKRLQEESLRQLPVKIKLPVDVKIETNFDTGKIDITEKLKELTSGIDVKNVPIPLHMNFQVERDLEAARKKAEGIADEEAHSLASNIGRAFSEALSNISIEGLSSIGETIGDALAGGDISDSFKKFGQMLGGAVQALGKQIIALSVAALAAKKAIKGIFANPLVGIAAGVALVAVGAALKNLLGGGIKGFATGGKVPGHGSGDTVPAMLTPGEYVVPKHLAPLAEKLFGFKTPKSIEGMFHFAGGGTVPSIDSRSPFGKVQNSIKYNSIVDVNITGESRTRGRDLVYVWNQEIKSQRRST
jgi:hypothetical protein